MKKYNLLSLGAALLLMSSCSDDFLDKSPRSNISADQLSDLAASSPEAALTLAGGLEGGTYFFLNDFNTGDNGGLHDDFGHMAVNLGTDMMSNDMLMTLSHWFVNYYNYTARIETSNRTDMIWSFYYRVIRNMNEALVFVPEDTEVPELLSIKGRLLAIRGFAYFQLVRLYSNGDLGIPLYVQGQPSIPSRTSTEDVKALILSDFTEAHALLEDYSRPNKVSVNQQIVAGFLARYYLEYGENALAAQFAAEARQGYSPMNSTDLLDGFNKIGNPEWMWGADINTASSTIYASFFSHIGNLNPGYAGQLEVFKVADKRLTDAIPSTDARSFWFSFPGHPYEFATPTGVQLPVGANVKFIDDTTWEGDYVFMRAAEMYLIEAEAKAALEDFAGARQILTELIVTRDPAFSTTNTGDGLVNQIRLHRRIELWGEGFAFFDMKRWGVALQRDYPGTNHNALGLLNYPAGSPKFIFQIPISEVNANPTLGEQNPF